MRGKPPSLRQSVDIARITPAGAGKTLSLAQLMCTSGDHPRRCGENPSATASASSTPGSPPQVRGKPIAAAIGPDAVGITPAGAGKTKNLLDAKEAGWDHPRRCGENGHCCTCRWFCQGSPPQVRGKPQAARSFARGTGITPAGAGKTKNLLDAKEAGWDHPRRCGENVLYRFLCSLFQGSPPQVRGKLIHIPPSSQGKRITPAGAGKTIPYRFLCWDFWDHPRRCGENVHRMRPSTRMPGSPPQVRGKQLQHSIE